LDRPKQQHGVAEAQAYLDTFFKDNEGDYLRVPTRSGPSDFLHRFVTAAR